jgi:hypothetical protein
MTTRVLDEEKKKNEREKNKMNGNIGFIDLSSRISLTSS